MKGQIATAVDGSQFLLADRAVKKPDQVSPRPPTQMAKGERGATYAFTLKIGRFADRLFRNRPIYMVAGAASAWGFSRRF
jgi:hypothetical protein